MSWQAKYPDLAKGLEKITEKKVFIQRTAKVYKATTPEEDKERLRLKKEKLRETHQDVYDRLPATSEPDWGVILRPRDPFRK